MARYGKQRRARRKRQEREHQRWANEESGQVENPRGGEFVVLLWPDMTKTKPVNWKSAEEIWRNHHSRAMIFKKEDFNCNG
jgi:hypothetical protein